MKKHILFVGTFLPAPGFGSSPTVYRHLNRLKDWQVSIIADRASVNELQGIPAQWKIVEGPRCGFRFSGPAYERLSESERPSHIINYFGINSLLAYHLSKKWDVPLLILLQDPWEIWARSWIEWYHMKNGGVDIILNHASRIWAVSEALADRYCVRNPQVMRIMRPIPEGNPGGFAEWREELKNRPIAGFSGSFRLHEINYLRNIAITLKKINGFLFITTTKNNIAKILLWGHSNVTFEEPSAIEVRLSFLKARANCVLVPFCFGGAGNLWRSFTFPSKLIEFVHTGLPVIILAPRGVPVSDWAKEHKWLGYLDTLDDRKIMAFFQQVKDKEFWIKMAQQSRDAASGEFDPNKIQAQFESELVVK